jgi:predicted small secreted protein
VSYPIEARQVSFLLREQAMNLTRARMTRTKLALSSAIVVLTIVLVGCKHTDNGFGRDVEKAGEKIQEKTE